MRDLDADEVSYELTFTAGEDDVTFTAGGSAADALGGGPDGTVRALPPSRDPADRGEDRVEVVLDGWRYRFAIEPLGRARLRDAAGRAAETHGPTTPQVIRARIPGRVVSVAVAPGDHVEQGQRLLAVEAMKMENEIRAPRAGTVESVAAVAGGTVDLGDELVRII